MQIVRTIVWVVLLVALLLFSIVNWDPTVTVRIWENLVVDTKIPAIVVVSFLIGFVPTWLYHRAVKWQLKRRIASLESTARTQAAEAEAADRPVVTHDAPVVPSEPRPVEGAPRPFDTHPDAHPDARPDARPGRDLSDR